MGVSRNEFRLDGQRRERTCSGMAVTQPLCWGTRVSPGVRGIRVQFVVEYEVPGTGFLLMFALEIV